MKVGDYARVIALNGVSNHEGGLVKIINIRTYEIRARVLGTNETWGFWPDRLKALTGSMTSEEAAAVVEDALKHGL